MIDMAFLTRFATLREYADYISNPGIQLPNVSYVDELDSENRHTHIIKEMFNFGDILLYHTKFKIKFAVNVTTYEEKYKNNPDVDPQALCVIPTGLLPDGYARFIAIKFPQQATYWNRNQTSLDHGKTWSSDYPGMYNTRYGSFKNTDLTNYTSIRLWDKSISLENYLTQTSGSSNNARTPIERSSGSSTTTGFNTVSNINSFLKYYVEYVNGSESTTANYTQPLYLEDWSLNPAHFSNLRNSDYLNDIDGYSNTKYLASISEDTYAYDQLATTNDITWGHFSAALKCFNYSTIGIPTGWYLPAIAELALGLTRYDTINNLLSRITGVVRLVSSIYWSSTEYSAYNAVTFTTSNGLINNYLKYNSYYILPFYRL